jgi:ketosteroid isomerase-like protein
MTNSKEEAQIRKLIDNWVNALRAKDLDGLMSHYAPDILTFDIAPRCNTKE